MPSRKPPKNRDYFTVDEVAKIADLTTTMVTYLERTGVFASTYTTANGKPWRQKGSWRRYTFRDMILLKVISKILAAGVQVKRLKQAMIDLRESHPDITPENQMAKYLVTNGEEVFFRGEGDHLETLGSGQYAFSFVLEFGTLHQDVVSRLIPEQLDIYKRFRQRRLANGGA